MKKLAFVSIIFIFCGLVYSVSAQKIENLRIKKLENKINIFYDLTQEKAGQLFNIQVLCSDNGGINYNIPLNTVSGDAGANVEGGIEKLIVWDVLADREKLSGDYVFKIIATPEKIENPSDYAQDFNFELIDCLKRDNELICAFKVKNNGTRRDLKLINRLARIYDSKGKRFEAQSSKLGSVTGNARYATPTLTFNPNQEQIAVYYFNVADGFSGRIKLLEVGVEFLEITYGLDLKFGNLQYKDLSFSQNKQATKTELISEAIRFDIKPESRTLDNKAPKITFTSPALTKQNPITVNTEELVLSGKVSDESSIFELTINGMYAGLNDKNEFKTDVYLAEGNNNIFVRVVDEHQNSVEETYPIIYKSLNKKDQRQTNVNGNNPSAVDAKTKKDGKYYALLIGVSTYPDPNIMNLDQPEADAEKLYNTLTKLYSFDKENVKLLKSPTREQIIDELDKLNRMITEDDNLLVFYAGHGYWDEQDEVGYWLPSDAKKANTANWMRNSTIRDYLRTLKTKHTLLIADACFSGGIFKTRKAFNDAPKSVQKLYEYPSRKAMTSGSLKEVPDRSVFLLYLNKRLTENTQDFISAEELFSSFKTAVLNNSPNVPQYGEVKDTGDEGGDFIFMKRSN